MRRDVNRILISNRQLTAFTTLIVCGYATFVISAAATTLAKQDAWIAAIISMIYGAITLWITSYLGSLFPDKAITEIIKLLLGKWIGGFVIVSYVFMCFVATCQIMWYIADFIATMYMPGTPFYALIIIYGIVLIIAMLYGLETIMRSSEIFFLIITAIFILETAMSTPNIKVENILPVMENGIGPILKSSIVIFAFSGMQMILLNSIYSLNVKDIKSAKRAMFKGYFGGMSIILVTILTAILVLGPVVTANSRFPTFLLAKEINIGMIFTRVEALTIISWILTILISSLLYFYNGVLGIAQLIGISDHKKIVIPYGLLQIVIAGVIYDNVPYQMDWDSTVWPLYIFTFGILLPILLLIIARVKGFGKKEIELQRGRKK